MNGRKARLIAFYLPQFHPIPENDEWWGKGFTEWTNTVKAKPFFKGHYQPHVPSDLGFYDLRLPEAREAQAEIARAAGVEGFCYWHYWFNGKRLLERPFNEVLASGKPDLPFCVGWANDSWTGIWHGCPGRMLMEQTYPGPQDEEAHFKALLPAFTDDRYITVDGRPLVLIYHPQKLPEPKRFIEHWNELAHKAGLKGVYFVGNTSVLSWDYVGDGFDSMVPHNPGVTTHFYFNRPPTFLDKVCSKLTGKTVRELRKEKSGAPDVMEYSDYIARALPPLGGGGDAYSCVVPNWDNTPRCGARGYVLNNSTPELFHRHLSAAVDMVADLPFDKRIIFLKSWNEWAEGNYMEPDLVFGRQYLDACRDVIFGG